MWSAARSACAAMVSAGFTAADDGKNDASITNKFSTSCDRHQVSSTDVVGSVPNTAVPHWWVVLTTPREIGTTYQNPTLRNNRLVTEISSRCASAFSGSHRSRICPSLVMVTRLLGLGKSSVITSHSTPLENQKSYAACGTQRANRGPYRDLAISACARPCD